MIIWNLDGKSYAIDKFVIAISRALPSFKVGGGGI